MKVIWIAISITKLLITFLTGNSLRWPHIISKSPLKFKVPSNQLIRTNLIPGQNHINIRAQLNSLKLRTVIKTRVIVKMNRVILRAFSDCCNPLKNYAAISKITRKNYWEKIKISNKTWRRSPYITDHHSFIFWCVIQFYW